MTYRSTVRLLALLFVWQSANGFKILITTVGLAGSQNLVMYRLADLLGAHNNDVTILKWIVNPEAPQPKLKYAKEISYPLVGGEDPWESIEAGLNQLPWKTHSLVNFDMSVIKRFNRATINGCERFLNDTENPTHKQLFNDHFDAIVIHVADMCTFGIAKMIGNPSTIWMNTAFMPDHMAHYSGVPYPVSYVPSAIHPVTDKMTFLERIKNSFMTISGLALIEYGQLPAFTEVFRRKAGDDFPDFTTIIRETQLYFVNADPFFEYARPTQHNIIYVGGLTMQNEEPLSAEWVKIMDEASDSGVVVFSLGTVASTHLMPIEMKEAFVAAFSHFPDVTFVLRIDGELPKLPKNVKHVTWIPQKDLLIHPKMRAFITHGGYNSLTEATYSGVPLIVLPLWGDQMPNAKRVERLGIGTALDKDHLTEPSIVAALHKVLNDSSYNARAKRLSQMIREKPVSSADLAVRWIEYLAQFRTVDNLLPESRHLGLIQYYSLDVMAILVFAVLTIVYIVWRMLRFLLSFCWRLVFGRSVGHQKAE
uniref:glucuronosyltransferase n=1 Tax=Plectus sambesii TaxID=2011161 RepID=A0A914VDN0_9BILA